MQKEIEKMCPKCGKKFITKSGRDGKKFCTRTCANSRIWSDEDKNKKSISAKTSKKAIASRLKNLKFKQKFKDEDLIKKTCPICKKEFKVLPCKKKKTYCSKKCCNKDYKFEFKKKVSGGIREGSGRSKSGWYKGYYCGSTYELAWVIYNIDHNIKFERNFEGFDYIYKEKEHKYYPDFIKENTYYEIKGFKRENDDAKFNYFPYKLKVLFKKDLKEIFKYVIEKHGNDFVKLYEGNPYNKRKKECIICGKPAKNMYCSRQCAGRAANKIQYKK